MLDFFRGNIYGFGRVDILNVAAILCSAHAVDGYDCGVDSHFHKLHSFFFGCNLIVYVTIRHLYFSLQEDHHLLSGGGLLVRPVGARSIG